MIPREVFAETIGQFFEPIRPLLDDPTVADIMINGPDQIYVERKGVLELTGLRFSSREALEAALRNAAQFVGKTIDAERPILEGRLPDGSRIEAVLPPTAPDGPSVSIRRFFKETLTVARLVRLEEWLVSRTSSFEELGLDSMAAFSLTAKLSDVLGSAIEPSRRGIAHHRRSCARNRTQSQHNAALAGDR